LDGIDDHTAYGYRRGVAHEVRAYREILSRTGLSHARFIGGHVDDNGNTWLVMEYLDGCESVETAGDAALAVSASWIGAFHAQMTAVTTSRHLPFLRRYDARYYMGWARRSAMFAGSVGDEFGWFRPLCQSFGEAVELLVGDGLTVVHGEYTVENVLARGPQVFPIDWETAAVGPGEIDLVTLTHGWPRPAVEGAQKAYTTARWGASAPADHAQRRDAAALYSIFRWLGYRPSWPSKRERREWLEGLHAPAARLGLI
jgi:aminoglycoside phosphotransferase (APT) family kinase protein